jgi:glutaredoxin
MKLTLLSRGQCGLCEDAVRVLRELRLDYEVVDIDTRPRLLAAYGDVIPVVLAGDQEVCRAPITRASLSAALKAFAAGPPAAAQRA